jgi:hypothetical protein
MNFGKWIVVAFVFFALFIGTLVTICVRQDIPLVTEDYYKEELAYQEQIDRMNNTNALAEVPEIRIEAGRLTVSYDRLPEIETARLSLVRPSDANLDQMFDIKPSGSTSQEFQLANPIPGLYRAKLTWIDHGKEFYLEKIVVL